MFVCESHLSGGEDSHEQPENVMELDLLDENIDGKSITKCKRDLTRAPRLMWDLFVGRAIWLDSVERGTPFTWAALLLTNGIGPPGLLLYVLLSVVTGNGLPSLGYSAPAKE